MQSPLNRGYIVGASSLHLRGAVLVSLLMSMSVVSARVSGAPQAPTAPRELRLASDPPSAEPPVMLPFLRGINFNGQNFSPGNQWPVAPAVDYYLTQKKMNVVRLNLMWELMQPTMNGPLDAAQVAGITDQVARITATGAYVIIEPHNDARRTVSGTDYIIGETSTVTAAHFADFWRRIATQWKATPRVIFELFNEPHDQNDQTLVNVANAAIVAVRSTGATNLILVSGNSWGSRAGWQPGFANYAYIGPEVVDSGNNFAFDIHHYFDDSSGQHEWCQTNTWQAPLQYFTTWARARNKRAFIGEFGVGANAVCGLEAKALLDYIEANRDVWLGWAWWGGGGWWPYSYIYRLDPYASQWDATNPHRNVAIGGTGKAVNWDRPRVDVSQMSILQSYLPAGSSAFNGPALPANSSGAPAH